MTEKHSPTRSFWLGGKRAAEQDRFFREALEPLGWQVGDEHDWDAGWITGMPDAAQFRRVSPTRKMNHFPGNAALTVKSRLHDSLSTLRERIRESHGADHELVRRLAFFPRAYVMPGDYHALQEAALADPAQRWILKPTNASKGKGVRVLQDVAEAPLARDWLVQEYLANPHTIRGHKYVLRLYVLITSLEPLRVYLYRQGFAKLASEPWDPEDADNPYSQLTNPDINALNSRAEVPVEFIDLERYRAWLRDQGHDDEALFARIEDLVTLTAISAVDALRRRTAEAGADPRGCYELLGLDCLVDDTLKPWILECNLSPSLGICAAPETGGRIEEAVKGGLVHDLVSLVDIPGQAPSEAGIAAQESDVTAQLVVEAEAEQARAGGFLRLLPAADPERYLPYFTLPTSADLRLAEALTGRSLPPPRLQRRHVAELVDEERLALYDTRRGRYYRPNDTATLTWLLATEGLDPDAIADELARATTEAGAPTESSALRRDVWNTLHDWCRAGLLCQQGVAPAALPEARELHEQTMSVSPSGRAMRLSLDGRHWALDVGSGPAMARLTTWFGERLSPLADEAASRLPRLAVLRESGGYALATDDRLLASRLTLAQLGPVLTAHLIRQAAMPGRPVVDAALLVTPHGNGVLCLLPDEKESRALLQRLLEASGGVLTRGVRLDLSDPAIAEPLDFPLPGVAGVTPSGLPDSVALRGMLLPAEASADQALAPVAMLEALGALLPNCLTGDGQALDAQSVTILGDWLSSLAVCALRAGPGAPDVASLAEWLVTRIEIAPSVNPPAMARG
ncbi:PqqD family peptide modification chaperone [Halomonas rhizosphaerae]|uniref:PqqD family peptide modification chaperone n=1 Tax=Halomonas rhizosphaerae TaxID=3043296 RepID=A0ABT6UYD6_9GAMM|nr:PqqD family peptide modification chaperone [Halomonas rhizosphaerae]MDI5890993.1 PqqD family peptide modification chaperone [Halomonas rhizosphaerae]